MSSMDNRTPLIRLAKRSEMSPRKIWAIRVCSIIVALILGCIPMMLTGNNPVEAYGVIIQGSVSRPVYLKQTIRIAIPLLGCALAIAPCFKMRFWNIGAEGQVLIGCLATAMCMFLLGDIMPTWLLILTMTVASIAAGIIWGVIPAVFKANWGTNETLFTLMMNYVALYLVAFFVALHKKLIELKN